MELTLAEKLNRIAKEKYIKVKEDFITEIVNHVEVEATRVANNGHFKTYTEIKIPSLLTGSSYDIKKVVEPIIRAIKSRLQIFGFETLSLVADNATGCVRVSCSWENTSNS